MLAIWLLLGLTSNSMAAEPTRLVMVQSHREDKVFRLEHQFSQKLSLDTFQVSFDDQGITLQWPDATYPEKKQISKVEDRFFKSLEIQTADVKSKAPQVRTRVSLNPGVPGRAFEAAIMAYTEGQRIIVEIGEPDVEWLGKTAGNFQRTYKFAASGLALPASDAMTPDPVEPLKLVTTESSIPVTTDSSTNNAMPVLAEAHNASTASIADEKKIPVNLGKQDSPNKSLPSTKLLLGLSGLFVLLIAVAVTLKKVVRKEAGKKLTARIQVVAQHSIGPKKSLMIVHVAGESMLLGVTDSNIQMIKSLALIDDEVQEDFPKSFGRELEKQTGPRMLEGVARNSIESEPDNFALRGLDEIRDVVSEKLKGLRSLG